MRLGQLRNPTLQLSYLPGKFRLPNRVHHQCQHVQRLPDVAGPAHASPVGASELVPRNDKYFPNEFRRNLVGVL